MKSGFCLLRRLVKVQMLKGYMESGLRNQSPTSERKVPFWLVDMPMMVIYNDLGFAGSVKRQTSSPSARSASRWDIWWFGETDNISWSMVYPHAQRYVKNNQTLGNWQMVLKMNRVISWNVYTYNLSMPNLHGFVDWIWLVWSKPCQWIRKQICLILDIHMQINISFEYLSNLYAKFTAVY